MSKTKIVFLAGLPRSGTTFIQSRLCREGLVCLGEVNQTIKSIRNDKAKVNRLRPRNKRDIEGYGDIQLTSFWADIENKIIKAVSHIEALEIVYEHASKAYPGALFVDSSKHIGHLKKYEEIELVEVFVIHVIRDYRGWEGSFISYFKRNELVKPKFIPFRWMYVNFKLAKYLSNKKTEIKSMAIHFDRFIINKEYESKVICDLDEFKPYQNEFHECFGSRHNISRLIENEINYDCNWVIQRKPRFFDGLLFKFLTKLT